MRILGIAGSLRKGSYNRALLRTVRELLPEGVELVEHDIGSLPFYDGDALVVATPEYNRGVPGVLKNAIDWASRPPLASPLTGKPVAVMGASTGRGGTARAQEQLRAALEFSRATVLEQPEVLVPEAFMRFDEHGELVDGGIRAELAELVDTLVGVAGGVTLAA